MHKRWTTLSLLAFSGFALSYQTRPTSQIIECAPVDAGYARRIRFLIATDQTGLQEENHLATELLQPGPLNASTFVQQRCRRATFKSSEDRVVMDCEDGSLVDLALETPKSLVGTIETHEVKIAGLPRVLPVSCEFLAPLIPFTN